MDAVHLRMVHLEDSELVLESTMFFLQAVVEKELVED